MAWPFIRGAGIVCVEKGFFYLHLASAPLNHLVHNRNIKMSKWPDYFCGINNTSQRRGQIATALESFLVGEGFLFIELQVAISLCWLVDILKQAGDSRQAKSN